MQAKDSNLVAKEVPGDGHSRMLSVLVSVFKKEKTVKMTDL